MKSSHSGSIEEKSLLFVILESCLYGSLNEILAIFLLPISAFQSKKIRPMAIG
jgi:hypothetical protein